MAYPVPLACPGGRFVFLLFIGYPSAASPVLSPR